MLKKFLFVALLFVSFAACDSERNEDIESIKPPPLPTPDFSEMGTKLKELLDSNACFQIAMSKTTFKRENCGYRFEVLESKDYDSVDVAGTTTCVNEAKTLARVLRSDLECDGELAMETSEIVEYKASILKWERLLEVAKAYQDLKN